MSAPQKCVDRPSEPVPENPLPLRVLLVEDSEDDAWCVIRELEKGGFVVTSQRVDDADGMRRALVHEWDIIIADYSMPGFGAIPALAAVQEGECDIPFIVVSGAVGEETAVAAMRAGARDYLMKNSLTRLGPVVWREVDEARRRRERRRAEDLRVRQTATLQSVTAAANQAASVEEALVLTLDQVCHFLGWSLGSARLLASDGTGSPDAEPIWHEAPGATLRPPARGTPVAESVAARQARVLSRPVALAIRPDGVASGREEGDLPAGTRALAAVPVLVGDEMAAVLEFFDDKESIVDESLSDFFVQIASQLARVVERERAAREIHRLNEQLQKRVEARTSELEVANDELEIFRQSVTHDLREPLGRIDGLNQVVLEDYGDTMDGAAKQCLSRARLAAQRMGDLVDNLLEHSRAARTAVRHDRVDLSDISEQIVAELRSHQPERMVDVRIEPGLSAVGDRVLVRIALKNFLANAWKFTRNTVKPWIEVGSSIDGGERVFYVRDNGAGFDMAYAGKLFSPFQRLHPASEFEGNGMGLASARQGVLRHGGRVWAEAAVGKGATFFFTLPER